MRKFLAAGILAVFVLFLPSKSHAVPLDVPYGNTSVSSFTVTSSLVLSSVTLPSSVYSWCLTHLAVSVPSPATFTMYISSMNTLTPSTTNYTVSITTSPYDTQWSYRTPYCAPAGNYLGLKSSVSGSTITVEGYTFGGWSNP